METSFRPWSAEDRGPIIEIFNYYIKNSFAAYPEEEVDDQFFAALLQFAKGYPAYVVLDEGEEVIGFAFLRPYSPLPVFSRVAEISYFIRPGFTRRGIGRAILQHLIDLAKRRGIDTILGGISSLNPDSIAFHQRNGFVECGRFCKIGRKREQEFDVVWMQRFLE
ncbi:MAG: N-acetyltransferase [Firmicutes bacterium]|nr:N-acetyltransferase [Bacillota bacterium]